MRWLVGITDLMDMGLGRFWDNHAITHCDENMSHCESPYHAHLQGRLSLEGRLALRGNRVEGRKRLLGQEKDTEHPKAMQGGWFG